MLHHRTKPLLAAIVAHYEGLYGEAEKTSSKRGVAKIEAFSWTFDGHFLEIEFFADTCNETCRVWQTFRIELSVDDESRKPQPTDCTV
ncbi:MAG: hypothetical protein ACPG4T_03225 [Nannocystaceae bacterium]